MLPQKWLNLEITPKTKMKITPICANLFARLLARFWKGRDAQRGIAAEIAQRRKTRVIVVPELNVLGMRPLGMTMGENIFIPEGSENDALMLAHELVHIEEQWRKYGDAFALLYLFELLRAGLRDGWGRAYLGNKFEREAYAKQNEYLKQLS